MAEAEAIERFLSTGEYDPRFGDFAGDEETRHARGAAALREVLRRVVGWRARHAPIRPPPVPPDAAAAVRARVAPLVNGLFGEEAPSVLAALPSHVVFLTAEGFGEAIESVPLRTAWDLANLLLDDLGAPPLADDTPELDGMCAAGRAWLLPRELAAAPGYPDVVVHEVAHLTHHLRRVDVGLPGKGPLMRITASRRETFAYACELWSAISVTGDTAHAATLPDDARVDRPQLAALLAGAIADPSQSWASIRQWAESP